ncbi:MAG: hypothetical protein WCL31_06820, partial [Actinomycetes bacterium]
TFVTHGQLKEVARHFFDRLQAELYYPTGQPYPWDAPSAKPAADYAMANLGHIKSLFQFDLTTDSDGDGIPDWWETAHGLNPKDRGDALASSEGGEVSNLSAYLNNLDPGAALTRTAAAAVSVLSDVTLTSLSKSLGGDASTALNPGSSPLVLNGDFQKDVENSSGMGYENPGVGLFDRRRWYVKQQSSTGWKGLVGYKSAPGDPGTRVDGLQYEVQQRINDYTLPSWFLDGHGSNQGGKLNQYCELDAHWERLNEVNSVITNSHEEGHCDRTKISDSGIYQTIQVNRGYYVLIFDYRGRIGVKNTFNVWVESNTSSAALVDASDLTPSVAPIPPTTGEVSTTSWKRAVACFKVEGGNLTGNNIDLKFNIPTDDVDSYGAFVDNVILLPIKLLDKDKNPIDELKIGKMEDTGVLSGAEGSTTLNIDNDRDRFYVQIPGAGSLGPVSISVATAENSVTSYDDDATEIDMNVDGNDLITQPMLLVSDDIDDDYLVDGVADDAKNDRTHIVQLGGKFQIKNITIGGTEYETDIKTPIPVKKTVTLGVVILRNKALLNGGVPVILQADVEADLKIAQERYAQTGIKLEWSITTEDPPAGVNLVDGLSEYSAPGSPTSEETALFDGTFVTATQDDIQVIYVNNFSPAPGSSGEAFWRAAFSAPLSDNVIISASGRKPFTLAHEVGHLLENSGNHVSSTVNLLRSGTSTSNSIGASKRLTDAQTQTMKGSTHAQ